MTLASVLRWRPAARRALVRSTCIGSGHGAMVASAAICVALQLIVTLLFPTQRWSMSLGMGLLALPCAVASAAAIPTASTADRWRWRLMSIGFVLWGMAWIVSAYAEIYGTSDQPIAKLSILRQLFFIAALLSIGEADDMPVFRMLDVLQGLIFSTLLTLMIWPAPFSSGPANPDRFFSYVGYFAFALLAVINWLSQPYHDRDPSKALAILFTIYASTSIAAMEVMHRFAVSPNSPVWIVGDAAFLAFIIVATTPVGGRLGRPVEALQSADRRQIGSLLLTVMLLMVAFAVSQRTPLAGSLAGILGMLVFMIRTSLVQRRYLALRDNLIAFERRRSRDMIDMVHEIRAPLGSMVLNATLLGTSNLLADDEERWVHQIRAGGTRVTALLTDVLELERLQAGMIELSTARHDVAPLIEEAIAAVAPHAHAHGVAITHRADLPHWGLVDPAKLTRVIVNLLMNAIRFTPRGGGVTIKALSSEYETVVIEIADTGVGIDPEILDTLFGRFSHRGMPVNGDRGSGLGLAISQALLNATEGHLALRSKPGIGTTATITVPGRKMPTDACHG